MGLVRRLSLRESLTCNSAVEEADEARERLVGKEEGEEA